MSNSFILPNQSSSVPATAIPQGNAAISLKHNTVIEARIVADLGEGRYTIEVPRDVVPSETAGAEGATETTRLVISSAVPLPVGEEVAFSVQREGEGITLQRVRIPLAASMEAAGFQQTRLDAVLALPLGEEGTQLAAQLVAGAEISLIFEGHARVVAEVPPGGTAIPVEQLVFPGEGSAPFLAGKGIPAELLTLLNRLPEGGEASMMVSDARLFQAIQVTSLPPTVDSPLSAQTESVSLTGRFTAQVVEGAGTLPILDSGAAFNGTVMGGTAGRVQVQLPHQVVEIDLGHSVTLPIGSVVTLEAAPPMVALSGSFRIALPSEAGTVIPATVEGLELSTVIREAGLNPSPQVIAAAQALRGEGLAMTRQNLQVMVAAVAEAGGQGEALMAVELFRAAAHLLKQDVPLAAALIRGQVALTTPVVAKHAVISQVSASLMEAQQGALPELAQSSLEAASQIVNRLPVVLGVPQSSEQLASYIRTMVTPQLQEALALVEGATTAILESSSELKTLDGLIGLVEKGIEVRSSLQSLAGMLLPEEREALDALLSLGSSKDGVEGAARLLARIRPENLPLALQELMARERQTLAGMSALTRMAEIHDSLRGLSEQGLAGKAQALAGGKGEPGLYVAEVPVRFDEQGEDAMMRVSYRQAPRKSGEEKRWSHRVVLDLNTTNLGPVLSDMRFSPSRLDTVVAVADEEAYRALASEENTLLHSLREKGFNPKFEFKVVIPETEGPPVAIKRVDNGSGDDVGSGHLDVEA